MSSTLRIFKYIRGCILIVSLLCISFYSLTCIIYAYLYICHLYVTFCHGARKAWHLFLSHVCSIHCKSAIRFYAHVHAVILTSGVESNCEVQVPSLLKHVKFAKLIFCFASAGAEYTECSTYTCINNTQQKSHTREVTRVWFLTQHDIGSRAAEHAHVLEFLEQVSARCWSVVGLMYPTHTHPRGQMLMARREC